MRILKNHIMVNININSCDLTTPTTQIMQFFPNQVWGSPLDQAKKSAKKEL